MKNERDRVLEDLDDIIDYLDTKCDGDPTAALLVRLYRTHIRGVLTPARPPVVAPTVDAPPKKRNHYKRRCKCCVTGTQVSDPLAVELRKKYKTPIIAERLNKIMEVLRSHATAMELEDLVPLTSLKRWCIDVHLKYAIAQGLAVCQDGKFWAKAVFDRRPDIRVHSKSILKEDP